MIYGSEWERREIAEQGIAHLRMQALGDVPPLVALNSGSPMTQGVKWADLTYAEYCYIHW